MLSIRLKNNNLKKYIKTKAFYQTKKLDKTSKECEFFGTDNEINIQKQILNQCALSKLKTKDQNLINLPFINIDSADKTNTNKVKKCILKLFSKEKSAGRVTILSDFFGKNKTHTVGIFENNNKLYIIDSLPQNNKLVKQYHKKLSQILSIIKKRIIFISKNQQEFDEYTCNNWTHSNIDTILKLKKDTKSLTSKIIKMNLLTDINKVLRNQKQYIEEKLNGRNICDITAQDILSKQVKTK